jgi:hypothetical protein
MNALSSSHFGVVSMLVKSRPRISRIPVLPLVLFLGILLSRATLADHACPDGNLLAGKLPAESTGILHPERLTDGVAAIEGEDWQVDLVATVLSDATLIYDLEDSVRVRSAFLQGDHRGPYLLQGSTNGQDWFQLWKTSAADGLGLRSRTTSALDHVLRFLRVVNPRPHEAFGLTDIQISCNRQAVWLTVAIREGATDVSPFQVRYRQQQALHRLNVGLLGGIGFFSLLFAARREHSPPSFWFGFVGAVLVILYATVRARYQPIEAESWLQFAAVATAAIALGLAARGMLSARHRPREERTLNWGFGAAGAIGSLGAGMYALVTGVIYGALHWTVPLILATLTVAATFSFRGARRRSLLRYLLLVYITLGGAVSATNFGTFFRWREVVTGLGADAELNRTTTWGAVSYSDQFHYYLGSKFFPELRYHLLYDCTALAELENGRGVAIERSKVRNLRDNNMEPGGLALRRAGECREAFSKERWEAFRQDVDYFRTRVERASRQRYLSDHGYNATPLWTAIGRLLSSNTTATDRATRLLALLDVAFLVGCVVFISWAFAPEAAALAALVWGVGHTWYYGVGGFGSFSRFDWLFAAVAGVCLLKKHRGTAGGFALVTSSLLRVFPGALSFGLGVRGLYQLCRNRRLDAELRRILLGALVGLAVLVPVSIFGTDTGSYGDFMQNSQKHAETPLSNYMGLRTMFSWDPELRARLMAQRKPDDLLLVWKQQHEITFAERQVWYGLAAAGLIGLTVLLSVRSSEIWLITLAGVVPMFCLFELTNYFYAIMALFAVWAYQNPRHTAVLLGLALGGTLVFLHLQWRALAYVANSALVLAVLVYFLAGGLLVKPIDAAQSAGPSRQP